MLFKLSGISKAFGNPDDASHQQVLNKLSLDLEQGETIAILGPSGSGKSTLLNILGTLESPDEGIYSYKDQLITDLSMKELDHFRNREIGFIFQFHHLLPQCNVLENILIPRLISDFSPKQNKEDAEALLQSVGLWEHRYKKPGYLSGGECQRVAVVRAMINRPSLILADEPTGALDRKNADSIADLLLKLNKEENIALVMVTHSASLASRMKTTYELIEGQLVRK